MTHRRPSARTRPALAPARRGTGSLAGLLSRTLLVAGFAGTAWLLSSSGAAHAADPGTQVGASGGILTVKAPVESMLIAPQETVGLIGGVLASDQVLPGATRPATVHTDTATARPRVGLRGVGNPGAVPAGTARTGIPRSGIPRSGVVRSGVVRSEPARSGPARSGVDQNRVARTGVPVAISAGAPARPDAVTALPAILGSLLRSGGRPATAVTASGPVAAMITDPAGRTAGIAASPLPADLPGDALALPLNGLDALVGTGPLTSASRLAGPGPLAWVGPLDDVDSARGEGSGDGTGSLGVASLAANPLTGLGLSPLGLSPLGLSPLGLSPLGSNLLGLNPLGLCSPTLLGAGTAAGLLGSVTHLAAPVLASVTAMLRPLADHLRALVRAWDPVHETRASATPAAAHPSAAAGTRSGAAATRAVHATVARTAVAPGSRPAVVRGRPSFSGARQAPELPRPAPLPAYPGPGTTGVSTTASGPHPVGGGCAVVPASIANARPAGHRPCGAAQVVARWLITEVPTFSPD